MAASPDTGAAAPTWPVVAMPAGWLPGTAHRRRLRALWRSAGWPCRDMLEAELLAAGLLHTHRDSDGRETVQLTAAGVRLLADSVQKNRQARSPHEELVARVALDMQRAGRVVWRGLCLRAWVSEGVAQVVAPQGGAASPDGAGLAACGAATARPPPGAGPFADQAGVPAAACLPGFEPVPCDAAPAQVGTPRTPGRWALAMPDVFSIRHTSVEAYLAPVAHEVKVRRADLLADLRRPAKGEAYRWLAAECWYVIREGIAEPEEIPQVYGVLVAPASGPLRVARPAPSRDHRLPFAVWMALARAAPEPTPEPTQTWLAAADGQVGTVDPGGQQQPA